MTLLLFGFGLSCFAQDALPFNDALKEVLTYLTGRTPFRSTVAVLGFQSDYPNLSEYIIDDITASLVDTDRYTVVDRRSLELLAQEMAFQLSGEVSDETALAIGRRLGPGTLFFDIRYATLAVSFSGSDTIAVIDLNGGAANWLGESVLVRDAGYTGTMPVDRFPLGNFVSSDIKTPITSYVINSEGRLVNK
ncbi:MAG: penicillin-binding protein activator LpoB [Treponema sp.]|jgi:hypothetical protein|nr:penicillin-binding protein activator LpoB [Treponema sp.]